MKNNPIKAFEAFGIELEYMIVHKETLEVLPIADQLLTDAAGTLVSEYEDGAVTWSNELVMHVIELKTTSPTGELAGFHQEVVRSVKKINGLLEKYDAMLLPGPMHPLMVPEKETKIWPHENQKVYELYNVIFDCKGHGWSNVQSMHINLPFHGANEFARLHAAIRLVLPLLPAIAGGSPMVEGVFTGISDTRLSYYGQNQIRIPSITGEVIPEAIFTQKDYETQIFERIRKGIARFDKESILDPVWVNSRGAIARFDRGSIEIRLIDVQEFAGADLALANLVCSAIKWLYERNDPESREVSSELLAVIYNNCINKGLKAKINNKHYLRLLELNQTSLEVGMVWSHLLDKVGKNDPGFPPHFAEIIQNIVERGNLSERIINNLGKAPDRDEVVNVYKKLAGCLIEDIAL